MSGLTPGQAMRFGGIVADTLLASDLDKESTQKFLGDPERVKDARKEVAELITAFVNGGSVVIKKAGSPKRKLKVAVHQFRPMPLPVQFEIIKQLYPKLDGTRITEIAEKLGKLRTGEELYQLVPKLSSVGQALKVKADPFHDGYAKCLSVVESALLGHVSQSEIRMLQVAIEQLQALEEQTPGDYLVIPIQRGYLYSGCAGRQAITEMVGNKQWPAPAWVILHYALTHREEVLKFDIDSLGDEMSSSLAENYNCLLSVGPDAFKRALRIAIVHNGVNLAVRSGWPSAFVRS